MSREIRGEEWTAVFSAAKERWPELDIDTANIVPTEASKVMVPVIQSGEEGIGAEEIPLERIGEFEIGYGPLANVLAVRAFSTGGYWYPVAGGLLTHQT